MRPWFENKNCTSLEIQFSDLKTNTKKNLLVHDTGAIQFLMSRIKTISPVGDEMISMIVAEEIRMNFKCDEKESIILFQNGMLKTPSTAFHSGGKDAKLGKELHADVKNLLQPSLGSRIFKFTGVEVAYADFSVTYKGSLVQAQDPDGPTIGPTSEDLFSIKDKAGKTRDLKIFSGQLPPQPQEIEVNGKKLTLFTYTNKKTGDRLYPEFFMIQD